MNKRVFISVLIAAISLSGFVLALYLLAHQPKVAYVNLGKLYESFELKKELEKQLVNVQQARSKVLDSLQLTLDIQSKGLQQLSQARDKDVFQQKAGQYEASRNEFAYRKRSFEEDNAQLIQQFDKQIWKQLNQYVKDYGDSNGYTYILGGDGNGTVMYAGKGEEITEQLLAYVNTRYKGEPKNGK